MILGIAIGIWLWLFFLCLCFSKDATYGVFIGIPFCIYTLVLLMGAPLYYLCKKRDKEFYRCRFLYEQFRKSNGKNPNKFDIREYLIFAHDSGWFNNYENMGWMAKRMHKSEEIAYERMLNGADDKELESITFCSFF